METEVWMTKDINPTTISFYPENNYNRRLDICLLLLEIQFHWKALCDIKQWSLEERWHR